jgi:IG-like fold at C-terminal of FixG, putative oxidoreductase
MTYTAMPDGRVSNLYNLKLGNKTHKDIPLTLKLENVPGEISLIRNENIIVKSEDYKTVQFMVFMNRQDLKTWKTQLSIGLYDSTKKIKTISAKFIGPEAYY